MLEQSNLIERLKDAAISNADKKEILEKHFPEVYSLLNWEQKSYSRSLGGQVSEGQYVIGLGAYTFEDLLILAARVRCQTTMYQEPWDCIQTEATYYVLIDADGPKRQTRFFTKDHYTVYNENHNWPAPPFPSGSNTPRFSLTGSSLSDQGISLRVEWLTSKLEVGIDDTFSPKEAWINAKQLDPVESPTEITPEISDFCDQAEKFASQLKEEQTRYREKAAERLAESGRTPFSLNQIITPQYDPSFSYAIFVKDFLIDSTPLDQQIATEVYLFSRATGEKSRVYRNVSDWFIWPGEKAPDYSVGVISLTPREAVLRTPRGDITIASGADSSNNNPT